MGWRECVTGNLKIITIQGDHLSIIKKPSVLDLASKLNEVLKEYN
jgi:thioesterase domain-containing protein